MYYYESIILYAYISDGYLQGRDGRAVCNNNTTAAAAAAAFMKSETAREPVWRRIDIVARRGGGREPKCVCVCETFDDGGENLLSVMYPLPRPPHCPTPRGRGRPVNCHRDSRADVIHTQLPLTVFQKKKKKNDDII